MQYPGYNNSYFKVKGISAADSLHKAQIIARFSTRKRISKIRKLRNIKLVILKMKMATRFMDKTTGLKMEVIKKMMKTKMTMRKMKTILVIICQSISICMLKLNPIALKLPPLHPYPN